jgi:hypothetical protein
VLEPPRNIAKRLLRLERRLDSMQAREARSPERPEYTDEEIVEIGLVLLAHVYEGDTERYAREHLVRDHGLPLQKAEEIAGTSVASSKIGARRQQTPNTPCGQRRWI